MDKQCAYYFGPTTKSLVASYTVSWYAYKFVFCICEFLVRVLMEVALFKHVLTNVKQYDAQYISPDDSTELFCRIASAVSVGYISL